MNGVYIAQRDLISAESLGLRTKYSNVLEYIVLGSFSLSTGIPVLFTQVRLYSVLILSAIVRVSSARIQALNTFIQYKVFVLALRALVLAGSLN